MANYVSSFANGAAVDEILTTVQGSNLSADHKITRGATVVVAASDSSAKSKAQADFVCTGTNDHVTIQVALDALPATGGEIHFLDGHYKLGATVARAIDNVTWSGCGYSTYLNYNASSYVISLGTQKNWVIKDMRFDYGGIDLQSATKWSLINIWRDSVFGNILYIDMWSADSLSANTEDNIYSIINTHSAIKLFSDFENDADWTFTEGTTEYDASIKYMGTRSPKITTPTSSPTYCTWTGPIPDLTNCSFRLMVYAEDPTVLGSISIDVRCNDTTWAHYYSHETSAIQQVANRWFVLVFPNLDVKAGTPDILQANQLRIRIKNVPGNSAVVHIDRLQYWKKTLTPKGAAIFSFDDGLSSTYMVAKPAMDKYNYAGVIGYVIGRMSSGDINLAREMQSCGWDIANHSVDHVNARQLSEPKWQILLAQKYLKDHGFKRGSGYFLLPFGTQSDGILTALSNNIQLTRSTIGYYNSLPGLGNLLYVRTISASTSLDTAKSWIDYAVANQLVVNFMVHDLVSSPTDLNWTPENFIALVDYCNSVGIEVLTYSQIVDRIKSTAQSMTTSGSGTIATGTTSINLRHGFAETPKSIQITPTSSLGSASSIWVSSKDTGTGNLFTVSVDVDPGVDVTFDWQATL